MVPANAAGLDALRRELGPLGPVWPCLRAADLEAIVRERRIPLVVTVPRDAEGKLLTEALLAVKAHDHGVKVALLYTPPMAELLDATRIVQTGACAAYLRQPVRNLASILRDVLSPRWRRGPEHTLMCGLLRPLRGAAQPFAVLAVMDPRAGARIGEMCVACGINERRVERDFARSLPATATERYMTPHRFSRVALCLSVAWWLAHGRSVEDVVFQYGFAHRYALAEHVRTYLGRSLGSIARPRHFREVYAEQLRRFQRR